MEFKYTPEEFDKGCAFYHAQMEKRNEFPSLPGLLVTAGLTRREYDAMCEDSRYDDVIEKYTMLRFDYCQKMQRDAKSANGFARLMAMPENGGYSEKNAEPQKRLIIEIREFKSDNEETANK